VALVLAGDAPTPEEEAEAAARTAFSRAACAAAAAGVNPGDAEHNSDGEGGTESLRSAGAVPRPRPACVLVAGAGGRHVTCWALPRPPAPRTVLPPAAAAISASASASAAGPATGQGRGGGRPAAPWAHPAGGRKLGGYGGHGAAVTALAHAPWRCGAAALPPSSHAAASEAAGAVPSTPGELAAMGGDSGGGYEWWVDFALRRLKMNARIHCTPSQLLRAKPRKDRAGF
jgi:hypothetical protein